MDFYLSLLANVLLDVFELLQQSLATLLGHLRNVVILPVDAQYFKK